MKELKNKEIIFGLMALIVLCILAIVLIVRRENDDMSNDSPIRVEEIAIENTDVAAEAKKPLQAAAKDDISNLAIKEEEVQTEVSKGEVISSKKVGESSSFHTEPKYKEYTGEEMWQLEEIYYYWMDYKLDAVDDLIHLPRVFIRVND